MTCTIEVEANGEALNSAGLATRLVVYGRITSGTCTLVRCRVHLFQGAPVLFFADASPDSNGTWVCDFPVSATPIACGTPFWVEAQCIRDGSCSIGQTVHVQCKDQSGGGEPQPPNGDGGGNNGNGGWPWPWPPAIFCPAIGRVFTQTLLLAVVALLAGVALLNMPIILGALAAIGVAFAVFFGIWTYFCQPHICYVLGAILWVAKRGTIVALVALVLAPHLASLTALWIIGAVAGVLTGAMRKRHCPIPQARTSINQLPVW